MDLSRAQHLEELKHLIALQRSTTDPKVLKVIEEMVADIREKLRDDTNAPKDRA